MDRRQTGERFARELQTALTEAGIGARVLPLDCGRLIGIHFADGRQVKFRLWGADECASQF